VVVVSAFAKVTDQLVLMGQQATSAKRKPASIVGDSAGKHFDTARSCWERKSWRRLRVSCKPLSAY